MILSLHDRQALWHAEKHPATRLIVLRHGEVDLPWRGLLYGQMDVTLSPLGEAQSRATGEALASEPIAAVYTSDLSRAATLGAQIARHHGLTPIQTDALRERHFGHWQGLTWEQIGAQWPDEVAQYHSDRFTMRVPGGAENFVDVHNRVVPCLREILQHHPGKTIVITCHSGPARIIIASAMLMQLQGIFTFEQDYCCINEIDATPGGRVRVRSLNRTDHLAGVV